VLKPTVFCAVPRVYERIYAGVMDKVRGIMFPTLGGMRCMQGSISAFAMPQQHCDIVVGHAFGVVAASAQNLPDNSGGQAMLSVTLRVQQRACHRHCGCGSPVQHNASPSNLNLSHMLCAKAGLLRACTHMHRGRSEQGWPPIYTTLNSN
jgi:hypothetical protein